MAQVKGWAEEQAARELAAAKAEGMTPARQYHNGRAVVLLLESGQYDDAAALLIPNLHRIGAEGTQLVAGMRSAVTMLDGARGMQAMDEVANVDAWAEGRPTGAEGER